MGILKSKSLDPYVMRSIRNPYWNQHAMVNDNGKLSQDIIRRDVTQGCVLLPVLFNILLFREALERHQGGVIVNGPLINIFSMDDTSIIAIHFEDLHQCNKWKIWTKDVEKFMDWIISPLHGLTTGIAFGPEKVKTWVFCICGERQYVRLTTIVNKGQNCLKEGLRKTQHDMVKEFP